MPTYFGASRQGGEQVALFGNGGSLRMRPGSSFGRTSGMRAMSGGGFGNFAPTARGFAGPVIGSRSLGMFSPQTRRGMGSFSPQVRGFGDAGDSSSGSGSGSASSTVQADNSNISAGAIAGDLSTGLALGQTVAGLVTGKPVKKAIPHAPMSTGTKAALAVAALAAVGGAIYYFKVMK